MQDDPLPVATWIMLSQFLYLLLYHCLPVGLVVDPNSVTVDDMHVITPTSDIYHVDCLCNPLLESWLTAVTLQPSQFIIDLEDYLDIQDPLSDSVSKNSVL